MHVGIRVSFMVHIGSLLFIVNVLVSNLGQDRRRSLSCTVLNTQPGLGFRV